MTDIHTELFATPRDEESINLLSENIAEKMKEINEDAKKEKQPAEGNIPRNVMGLPETNGQLLGNHHPSNRPYKQGGALGRNAGRSKPGKR